MRALLPGIGRLSLASGCQQSKKLGVKKFNYLTPMVADCIVRMAQEQGREHTPLQVAIDSIARKAVTCLARSMDGQAGGA